jgi:transcriptional regulator of NAD metabolism
MAQRELVDLFQETERFYKCLAQNLSIINRRVKHKLYGDCNDSLDVSFKDFKTMKKDSLK